MGWASAVAVGDFNNDGFDDLFLTYWGRNVLYRNNGDGTFTDITEDAGLLQDAAWGSGCTFVDYDRDGLLDLLVATYAGFDLKTDWLNATARTKRDGGVKSPGSPSIPEPCPNGWSLTDPSVTGETFVIEKFT